MKNFNTCVDIIINKSRNVQPNHFNSYISDIFVEYFKIF